MKSSETWVVVADGANARIFSNQGKAGRLTMMDSFEGGTLRSREIASSRPGRVHESVGGQRHSVGFAEDPQERQEADFLARLAAHLETQGAGEGFDHLLLVAPAKALGTIRKLLPPKLRGKVKAEFVHDYTRQPVDEVLGLVRASLPR